MFALLLPAAAVCLSAILWGLWWLPLRYLDGRGLGGDWVSVLLFGLGALVVLPFLRRTRAQGFGDPMVWLSAALLGIALSGWNHAVLVGEVVRVVLLFYLAPVWATLFAFVLLGEVPGRWRYLAIVLGLSGAVVVLGGDGLPVPSTASDWLALAAGMSFALSTTLIRKAPHTGEYTRVLLGFVMSALAALALAAVDPTAARPAPTVIVGAAVPLVLVAVAWLIPMTWTMLWGSARLDPGRVAILLMLEVAVAAVSSAALTDEPFGWRQTTGCLLVLAAGVVDAIDAKGRS